MSTTHVTTEGPLLETLTRRLSECPADFLAEPRLGKTGTVHVKAVIADVLRELGSAPLTEAQVAEFGAKNSPKERNRLRMALIICWLLHDPFFRAGTYASLAYAALQTLPGEMAEIAPANAFITDPERREELARLCLQSLALRPKGETEAQAQDRLATLNSIERQRVIQAARAAEARAQQIREEMARQAAYEASLKATRE